MNAEEEVGRFLRLFADALGVDHYEFMQHFASQVNMEAARQQEAMRPVEDDEARVFLDSLLQQMYPNVRSFNQ